MLSLITRAKTLYLLEKINKINITIKSVNIDQMLYNKNLAIKVQE